MRDRPAGLVPPDITSLNHNSAHPRMRILGPVGTRLRCGPVGLMRHIGHAFTPQGVPAGWLPPTRLSVRCGPVTPSPPKMLPAQARIVPRVVALHQETPPEPPEPREATRWIAVNVGFQGRDSDAHPGPEVLWPGLRELGVVLEMYLLYRRAEEVGTLQQDPVRHRRLALRDVS